MVRSEIKSVIKISEKMPLQVSTNRSLGQMALLRNSNNQHTKNLYQSVTNSSKGLNRREGIIPKNFYEATIMLTKPE